MQRKMGFGLMAAMLAGIAGMVSTAPSVVRSMGGGRPYHGAAGMAYGTKTRGNRAVKRAAAKRSNQQRHRKAARSTR